ncbi:hypothetical protein CCUS01_16800 [Colletotrichum cuscutae]|uniref:Uncharacterized protein n=1 Tax=Colletotrichum cuscutae TaxID=1209917 RepID=A0AAI9VBX2_9PEZI|nr:hypothetical protein CCUS01_16800 [Colletotrichum cuscutae]
MTTTDQLGQVHPFIVLTEWLRWTKRPRSTASKLSEYLFGETGRTITIQIKSNSAQYRPWVSRHGDSERPMDSPQRSLRPVMRSFRVQIGSSRQENRNQRRVFQSIREGASSRRIAERHRQAAIDIDADFLPRTGGHSATGYGLDSLAGLQRATCCIGRAGCRYDGTAALKVRFHVVRLLGTPFRHWASEQPSGSRRRTESADITISTALVILCQRLESTRCGSPEIEGSGLAANGAAARTSQPEERSRHAGLSILGARTIRIILGRVWSENADAMRLEGVAAIEYAGRGVSAYRYRRNPAVCKMEGGGNAAGSDPMGPRTVRGNKLDFLCCILRNFQIKASQLLTAPTNYSTVAWLQVIGGASLSTPARLLNRSLLVTKFRRGGGEARRFKDTHLQSQYLVSGKAARKDEERPSETLTDQIASRERRVAASADVTAGSEAAGQKVLQAWHVRMGLENVGFICGLAAGSRIIAARARERADLRRVSASTMGRSTGLVAIACFLRRKINLPMGASEMQQHRLETEKADADDKGLSIVFSGLDQCWSGGVEGFRYGVNWYFQNKVEVGERLDMDVLTPSSDSACAWLLLALPDNVTNLSAAKGRRGRCSRNEGALGSRFSNEPNNGFSELRLIYLVRSTISVPTDRYIDTLIFPSKVPFALSAAAIRIRHVPVGSLLFGNGNRGKGKQGTWLLRFKWLAGSLFRVSWRFDADESRHSKHYQDFVNTGYKDTFPGLEFKGREKNEETEHGNAREEERTATDTISTGNYVPGYLPLSLCRTGNWQLHEQLGFNGKRRRDRAGEMVPYKEVCMFLFSSRNANLLLLLLQYRLAEA